MVVILVFIVVVVILVCFFNGSIIFCGGGFVKWGSVFVGFNLLFLWGVRLVVLFFYFSVSVCV